jgi:hypothetical protein
LVSETLAPCRIKFRTARLAALENRKLGRQPGRNAISRELPLPYFHHERNRGSKNSLLLRMHPSGIYFVAWMDFGKTAEQKNG